MGIRLATTMKCEVTAISTSPNKEAKAREIGAHHFVVSTDPDAMKKAAKSLDIILDTAAVDHQAFDYFLLLDANGQLVLIGVTIKPHSVSLTTLSTQFNEKADMEKKAFGNDRQERRMAIFSSSIRNEGDSIRSYFFQ
ncbi:hypothetical protein TCAL_14513 [Tigriopus californicus]|uniref:Alcohol dehydrogenase-like C-terminal domain-containing protein n=1 Tax=Tigriopus californicus TaxID=6832 RepID=A0A553PT39_TIGCA|nr:hypothetical protein TCAL_14513 [Tigriopus californicus]